MERMFRPKRAEQRTTPPVQSEAAEPDHVPQPSALERLRISAQELIDRATTALRKPLPVVEHKPTAFENAGFENAFFDHPFFVDQDEQITAAEFNRRVDRFPRTKANALIAGVALLGTASAYALAERNDGVSESGVTSSADFVMNTDSIDIVISEYGNNHRYDIHIVDYNNADAWDIPWQGSEIPNTADPVGRNRLYQYHKGIFQDQYDRAFMGAPAYTNKPIADDFAVHTGDHDSYPVNKYGDEPARMAPGAYPDVAQMYHGANDIRWSMLGADPIVTNVPANFDFGDKEKVQKEFFGFAQKYSAEHGWGNDLQSLTPQQWVSVFDASVNGYPYDTHLVAGAPDYNEQLARKVNAMPISELMDRTEDGVVCRDLERMKLSFYVLADEQYSLADRGLQILPLVNFSDASHARDAYMIATSDREVTVVVTDSTNTAFYQSDVQIDSNAPAAAAWYGAQFAKEFMEPEMLYQFFDSVLSAEDPETIMPATEAIMKREKLIAVIQEATQNEMAGDTATAHRQFLYAWGLLGMQLDSEAINSGMWDNTHLREPERTVPLLDLMLALGKKVDDGDSHVHYLLALQKFSEYKRQKGMSEADLQTARTMLQGLDTQGASVSVEDKQFVTDQIALLEKELGLHK